MYIGKKWSFEIIWLFARKNLIKTFLLSTLVVLVYYFFKIDFLAIPFLPVASVGTAVAFYVGFKNNQSYDRLWEARRLWGGYTNTSRILAASFITLIDDKALQKDFLYRHIAYINIVRLQLRKNIQWATSDENYHKQFISESEEVNEFNAAIEKLFESYDKVEIYEKIKHKSNIANHALSYQFAVLTKLKKEKRIDEYEHSDLTKLLGELFNIQGGCERIKNTPLFRQYSIFSRMAVNLFIFLLPFGLLKETNSLGDYGVFLTIPFSMLISWIFMTMEQIGEASENPFDNGTNDTPISTICRNIEIDIFEMLNEPNLPNKIEPFKDVLL